MVLRGASHLSAFVLRCLLVAFLLAACAPQFTTPTAVRTPLLENPTPAPTATFPPGPLSTPTALPTLAPAAQPAQQVAFYHLRIEFSTTSDWTSLDFSDPNSVLAVRLVSTSGTPKIARVSPGQFYLSQAQDAAKAGQSVGLVADLALAAPLSEPKLGLVLKRGGIPATTLKISTVQGADGSAKPLLQTTHNARIASDSATNALPVSLDLSPLAALPPQTATLARPDVPRMLWAFYYPWYHSPDWNSAELRDHPLSTYVSSDPKVVAAQIDEAKSAGIDGFIASWWGPGSYTDQNLKVLLDVARQKDFKVFIYFETLQTNGPLSGDDIYKWLSYVIPAYRDAPAYMKWDGKPVIAFYNSGLVPLATWQDVFSRLHAQGLDVASIAMGLDAASLNVFDGFHNYAVITTQNLPQAFAQAGRAAHDYSLLAAGSTPKLWAATIQPGYDERLIPGRAGLVVDRGGGAYYQSTMQAALGSNPDWIFITSWNEWWENTYIEPGKLFGDQYLKLTKAFADQWKAGKTQP